MKKIMLLLILLLSGAADAKHLHPEKYYQELWCTAQGGLLEYKLDDAARVDCLLPDKAVEFDFANKWAECIGQALYYGKKTNRKPVCALIMEKPKSDLKYLYRLNYAVQGLDFEIITVEP